MPAATKNVLRDHGATTPWAMVYRQGRSLPPVDLTGCNAAFEITDRIGATVTLDTATGGGITLGTTGGEISVDLAHDSYTVLPAGEYNYKLAVVFAGGEKRYLVVGKWTIR